MPAFWTRMSRRPWRVQRQRRRRASASAIREMSVATKARRVVRGGARPASTSVSAMTSLAPSSAKRWAMPSPMPRAAADDQRDLAFEPSGHARPLPDGLLERVEQHGGEHQHAVDHLGVVRRQAHEVDRRVDGREQQHAGKDAGQAADAALEADAADHHRGEGLEQHADAEIGGGAGGADGQQPAGEAGDGAGRG